MHTQSLLLIRNSSGKNKNGKNVKQRKALHVIALERESKAMLHEVVRARDPHYFCRETCHGYTITRLP